MFLTFELDELARAFLNARCLMIQIVKMRASMTNPTPQASATIFSLFPIFSSLLRVSSEIPVIGCVVKFVSLLGLARVGIPARRGSILTNEFSI